MVFLIRSASENLVQFSEILFGLCWLRLLLSFGHGVLMWFI